MVSECADLDVVGERRGEMMTMEIALGAEVHEANCGTTFDRFSVGFRWKE